MKKKILLIVVAIIVCLGGGLYYQERGNFKVMEETISMIQNQAELEKNFTVKGYTLENPNVIVNPYGNSPLTALVMFENESASDITVTINGKDENTTFSHTFTGESEQYLPIYGLYANTNNEVVLESDTKSVTIHIQTEALPENMILPTSVYADKEYLDNDLYFFTPSSVGYTCAIDVNGDIRWYLSTYALWEINRLQNGHLLVSTERLINFPYYMTGLYEMDMLGKIYTEYSLPGGYHHDYFELPSGNLLVASDDFNNSKGTVEDYIVEIDRLSGQVVKSWDLKDILDMNDGKSENWIIYDWFHNNSVWYDEATNSITLSGRHQDAVINIDYESGELNYIIGDPTSWSEEYQKYFLTPVGDDFEWQWSQHAAMITPEGYVFIFDNGNNKSKIKEEYVPATESYSRGVMYKVDTEQMTIEQIYEYGKERGNEFYSPYISDVDYLEPNHYLIHSGGISYKDGVNLNVPSSMGGADTLEAITVEVVDDQIVFEVRMPTNTYRAEKMALYSNEEFYLGNGTQLGSLGQSEATEEYSKLLWNTESIDDIRETYNLKFDKEYDRLKFTGTFSKKDEVNVLFVKGMSVKSYHVTISQRPYTAMCVGIFNTGSADETVNITHYINDEGLSGTYYVYLEVNGTIYKTKYKVNY